MRVLVTGGAGFIGSHLVDLLRAGGHEPFVLDNLCSGSRQNVPAGVPVFEVDVCDKPAVARVFDEVRPEGISHQAAQMSVSYSVREPGFDAEVNVVGLINVLSNAARVGTKRFVFASSGGVLYGDVFEPAGEDHPASPISPYGVSKWAGEQYLKFFSREHGLQCVALRYSNVYGPRQNPHGEAGVVAIFAQRMFRGEPTTIHGDGKCIRDYVFVKDVARANLLSLETALPEKFTALNVGTAVGADVNELAGELHQLVGARLRAAGDGRSVPIPAHGPPRAGDLQSSLISPRRAEQLLGWKPQVNLHDGLRESVDWFYEASLAR